jgi:hypothetical protein
VIYVYAITDGRPRGLRDDAGFGEQPLRAFEHGALAAVYSIDPPRDLTPTEEALWHHERVLEELMGDRAVLPLRFASTLPGEEELADLLSARAYEFGAALAAVRGRVEMGVRATVDPGSIREIEPPVTFGGGRAYLAAKLERRRAAARLGEAIHDDLGPLARASTCKLVTDPQPVFAGAYLIDRDDVAGFRERCDRARTAWPGVELACTGPWPPFSFAEPMETA